MKRLFLSSKGAIAMIALVLTCTLVLTDKLPASYFVYLVGALVLGYQGATAIEDHAKHRAKKPAPEDES